MSASMEATPAPVVLNTAHARTLLHKRHPAPEWALLEEVAPNTGGGTRYADAVAVNLWQSRGYAVHGFEIKVSRGDWLRELKRPEKAEEVMAYCDFWWIVAPAGVVKDGELPLGWGHLEVRLASLYQTTKAEKRDAKPITRAFFASLMRRGNESIEQRAETIHRAAVQRAKQAAQAAIDQQAAFARRELHHLEERVEAFEKATGLTIYAHDVPATLRLAAGLRGLCDYRSETPAASLDRLAKNLEESATKVRAALAASGLLEACNHEEKTP